MPIFISYQKLFNKELDSCLLDPSVSISEWIRYMAEEKKCRVVIFNITPITSLTFEELIDFGYVDYTSDVIDYINRCMKEGKY